MIPPEPPQPQLQPPPPPAPPNHVVTTIENLPAEGSGGGGNLSASSRAGMRQRIRKVLNSFALWGPPNMAWAEAGRHRALVMAWKSTTSRCFSLRPGGTDCPPQGHRVMVRAPTLASTLIPRQKGKNTSA
ncbi:Solute carrier family 35 member F1 [Lemmus lemmus]